MPVKDMLFRRRKTDSNPASRYIEHHPYAGDYAKLFGHTRWRHEDETGDAPRFTIHINSLPPEILAECFHWYILAIYRMRPRLQDLDTQEPYSSLPTPAAWVVLRHVCRSWRDVSMTFPELSSYIPFTHEDCVHNLLHHSGELPLHLYDLGGIDTALRSTARTCIAPHRERVASLHVRSPGLLRAPPPPPTADRDAVITHLFMIRVYMMAVITTLRPPLTHHAFPRLEEFSCAYGILHPWTRVLGPALRRLSLCQCVPASSAAGLVQVLAQLPQLEEMVMYYTFRSAVQPGDGAAPEVSSPLALPVVMSNLRSLNVEDETCRAAATVLERLVYPSTTTVSFRFQQIPENTPDLARTFLSLFHQPDVSSSLTDSSKPQSVSIIRRCTTDVELLFWRDCLSVEGIRERSSDGDRAIFSFRCANASTDFVRALLEQAPLNDVRSALLMEPEDSESPSWEGVLRSLASVEDIGLEYDNIPIGDSDRGLADDFKDFKRELLLPKIQTAHVRERRRPSTSTFPIDAHPVSSLQSATDALDSRVRLPPSSDRFTIKRDFVNIGSPLDKSADSRGARHSDGQDDMPQPTTTAVELRQDNARGGLRTWLGTKGTLLRRSLKIPRKR